MPSYNVTTRDGHVQITADRYRRDSQGDLYFYNGSRESDPVDHFNADWWGRVRPEVGG